MIEIEKIPHIHEISNHGPYHGAREKNTATFQARSTRQNKLVPSLEEAIRRTGLKDGMTISFHHHFRNGDHIINTVVDKLAEMGYKNLTLAASSLAAVHAPLIRHIQNGVITHIETSGMRGELAEQVSRGLIDCPVVFRSHGGRASAIRSGDLHIDVAFLGAPSCDPYGNANGYSRDDEDGIACGSLGYARTDATYADNVIVITNHLVAYPNAPWAIPEFEVDYVVMTDDIGDPKGIMSGATRYTKDPKELLIAKTAANVIEAAGYLYDGFSMQMGSGGASLATARFLRQKMIDQNIHCRFALGGITGQIAAMHEEGLIDRILDVQSFDLDAAKSLKNNHFQTVHGLDADGQYSSARDMALIGQALIRDVPNEYSIYKEKEFTFNGIRQLNRNGLLWDNSLNVDGIKTGHTDKAGYNLVASATEGQMRLISAVMGGRTFKGREAESKKLLTWGFRFFETVNPLKVGKEFASEPVWFGDSDRASLGVDKDVYLTIPRGRMKDLKASYVLNSS